MIRRPRLTVRARLTLIYTGLFTLCGAIIVAVSYTLVAQLGVVQQPGTSSAGLSASYVALCKKAYLGGDKRVPRQFQVPRVRPGRSGRSTAV